MTTKEKLEIMLMAPENTSIMAYRTFLKDMLKECEQMEEAIEDVSAEVCDHLCKYRDTMHHYDLGDCWYVRTHDGQCPLDSINGFNKR